MSYTRRRREVRTLPAFYYLDNFEELLSFVRQHYLHVLQIRHAEVLGQFESLPRPARCLYVRLTNRKGTLFAIDKLRYPEIADLKQAAGTLWRHGFLVAPEAPDKARLLETMPKSTLINLAPGIRREWRKQECIDFVHRHVRDDVLVAHALTLSYVKVAHDDIFSFFRFLFSGRAAEGASELTLRDLGILRERAHGEYTPRFESPEDAHAAWFYGTARQRIRDGLSSEIRQLADAAEDWPVPASPVAALARDKFALALGRALEHEALPSPALIAYQHGESGQCVTSCVRVMAREAPETIRAYLDSIIADPPNDDALAVAEDIAARRFGERRRSAVTRELAKADAIALDGFWRGRPEYAAAAHFEKSGASAFRTENHFWRMLFGLTFHDLLFSKAHVASHSPFDPLPASLRDGSFLPRHRKAIDRRLQMYQTPKKAQRFLLQAAMIDYGSVNGVFRWQSRDMDAINAFLDCAEPPDPSPVLRTIASDFRRFASGFPDLMLVENGMVRWVEIKAPGDQLRRNQWQQIRRLRDAGMSADVVRIEWVHDPAQAYVVIDVETTGGRAQSHRVTEIGAVRVIGGEIVDRYSTLVNPGRTIPPHISRLTGITNDMVRGAPVFSDIADKLRAFLGDAIFCAHNVNFDYGFLKREYERLGESFYYPKLCTCASMRATFKGHDSYSLKALTDAYGISLNTHHRALCDAEAAAELLMLVQAQQTKQKPVEDSSSI